MSKIEDERDWVVELKREIMWIRKDVIRAANDVRSGEHAPKEIRKDLLAIAQSMSRIAQRI